VRSRSPKLLGELKARDIRAHIAQRRRDGLSDASVARLLSSIKALYRWLNRAFDIENAEVAYLAGPETARSACRGLSRLRRRRT
jgi:integrase/recombinase XerC